MAGPKPSKSVATDLVFPPDWRGQHGPEYPPKGERSFEGKEYGVG